MLAIQEIWGTGACTETLAPSLVQRRRHGSTGAASNVSTASPDVLAESSRAMMDSDVTSVLPAIQAPTLVISRRGDRHVRPEHGQSVASESQVPGLSNGRGTTICLSPVEREPILSEIEEFLTGITPTPVLDRVLVTVLFTDIVGSTDQVAKSATTSRSRSTATTTWFSASSSGSEVA